MEDHELMDCLADTARLLDRCNFETLKHMADTDPRFKANLEYLLLVFSDIESEATNAK